MAARRASDGPRLRPDTTARVVRPRAPRVPCSRCVMMSSGQAATWSPGRPTPRFNCKDGRPPTPTKCGHACRGNSSKRHRTLSEGVSVRQARGRVRSLTAASPARRVTDFPVATTTGGRALSLLRRRKRPTESNAAACGSGWQGAARLAATRYCRSGFAVPRSVVPKPAKPEGGLGGIRTHERLSPLPVFKTASGPARLPRRKPRETKPQPHGRRRRSGWVPAKRVRRTETRRALLGNTGNTRTTST
jgi:hypothetical protein